MVPVCGENNITYLSKNMLTLGMEYDYFFIFVFSRVKQMKMYQLVLLASPPAKQCYLIKDI